MNDDEKRRLKNLGNQNLMLLRNHGALTLGEVQLQIQGTGVDGIKDQAHIVQIGLTGGQKA